ncbi:MAG: serine/threonine protein kinase [Lachnospiraceae bacterium]|nr:serine/threonine protein kinase [Lachnospiraceae bacterium]
MRCIGKGGTSSVYMAEDVSIGKKWAVKFIEISDDTLWLAQNEINMMVRLDHVMFPRIVDAWPDENGYFIVSDYIEGVTLDRVIRKGRISNRTLISWWTDIARAIQYLHDLRPSILYLDLKLENIMLKNDGSLKLIDFGIAGRIADRGSLYGTPGYAAPEQYYNRGELLDERTDVFGFGMLMYAMYSGKRPDEDLDRQTDAIRNDRRLPGAIRQMILNCIRSDKSLRYRNMDEIIRALIRMGGEKKNAILIKIAVAAAVAVLGVFGTFAVRYVVAGPKVSPASRMMEELSDHIIDGEYTEEGIRIICGYIEAGCLDEETCGKFTYEVARNYFTIQRNYREALRYFRMLDEEEYPDAGYYMELCRLQVSFEEDNARYTECLNEFARYNRGLGYSEARYDNELMIANLYAGIMDEDGKAAQTAAAHLKSGLNDLRYAIREGLFTDSGSRYEAEYCRRLCIICEETGDYEGAVSYGKEALVLLDPERNAERDDISRRIKYMQEQ